MPDADLHPEHGSTWPRERRVPAELLRSVLLDPDLRPDPRGLWLRGALVVGALELDHAALPCRLRITRSSFTHPATLDTARIPALDLSGSCLPGLNLSGAGSTATRSSAG